MSEEIEGMTLEEAVEVCLSIDWADEGRFSKRERDAIHGVVTRYMVGEIDRDRCAEVLRTHPDKLPGRLVPA